MTITRRLGAAVALVMAVSTGAIACGDIAESTLACEKAVTCSITTENFSILVPAEAIPNGLRFTANRVTNPPDSLTIVPGTTWDLGPDGATFNPPATAIITLPSNALSTLPGVLPAELGIYRREDDEWVRIPNQTANIAQLRFTATIEHFSVYTVMGEPSFSVAITPPAQHTMSVGATLPLEATVRSEAGIELPDREVEWSSSNTSVATVSSNGLVTALSQGNASVTARAGTAQSAAQIVVNPAGPLPPATEPVPGASDVVLYDDNMAGFSTLALRHARRNELVNGTAPFYFFDGPTVANQREAEDSIITPGYNGSPFAYRIRVPSSQNNFFQASMYGEVFHRSALAAGARFHPPGATLVVDMWIRVSYPAENLLWIKGLELFHSFDRTQYGVYLSSGTLGWANIHPQSNNREIHMHLENGAPDAPVLYRRWSNISTGTWLKFTHEYKQSSGTGVARDGVNRMFVNGEKIIDASQLGFNTGWMVDRQNGVAANSTNPYPGNVGDKYTSVTGDQALLGLSDDPVIQIIWPGIISSSAAGGGGTIDLGRIRIWYRP